MELTARRLFLMLLSETKVFFHWPFICYSSSDLEADISKHLLIKKRIMKESLAYLKRNMTEDSDEYENSIKKKKGSG